MAQGRSTKIILMIKWIRTSRLSIKNSLSEKIRSVQAVAREVQEELDAAVLVQVLLSLVLP